MFNCLFYKYCHKTIITWKPMQVCFQSNINLRIDTFSEICFGVKLQYANEKLVYFMVLKMSIKNLKKILACSNLVNFEIKPLLN